MSTKPTPEEISKHQILFVIRAIESTCAALLAVIPILKGMLKS